MSINNVINGKKKALLAYKEKILDDIKYTEKSIDDFRANHRNKCFYDDHADSSDSEDEFSAIDMGPSITQLKQQQAMMKTRLHATQELTSLMVLQSEVDVLVEDPKFEGEHPVTEAGTWREVTAECRIDLVPFTMTFFMHTPDRKFAPPSYRGLRVMAVKSAHELELSNSVLHSLKVPSDAVEVLRSYAAGYRSRRTTLARLANKYTSALFMEPHAEGGFVLKCADLLEVSWRLENKWSPVAPFHHRMKFDLEFMEESYVKIITQAHKQLLDPAIQTDERTLLLAKIITTCLEAQGTIDTESDLESKTTVRDNDIDKRDSEFENRDSEIMAPPKSLPKKGKQKNKDSLHNTAQKRSMDDENDDSEAKRMRNDVPEAKNTVVDANNARKSKMNDVVNEGGKKRKMSEVNKVAHSKKVKETGNIYDGNVKSKETHKEDKTVKTKPKNIKESEKAIPDIVADKTANTNSKPTNMKESASTDTKNINAKTKNKVTKEAGDNVTKDINSKTKTKVLKAPANVDSNSKPKSKIVKETGKSQDENDKEKPKEINTKDVQSKGSASKNDTNKEPITAGKAKNFKNDKNKEPINALKVKNVINKAKNIATKETGDLEENNQNDNNDKTKNIETKKLKSVANAKGNEIDPKENNENEINDNTKNVENKQLKMVANTKSKENIDANQDAGRPKSKITKKNTNAVKNIESNINKVVNKSEKTVEDLTKVKNIANTKHDDHTTKKAPERNINVVSTKNNDQVKKAPENVKNKEKLPEVSNKGSEKTVKNDTQTAKIVTEKSSTTIRKHNIKKPIVHKIASHRDSLKPQNPPKVIKTGNTNTITTGTTEKENGGKGSKIPQKAMSNISEGSSKKNFLMIAPRKIPSKFQTRSQETFKQKMVKSTNIPRLLKKPAPKTT